MIHFLILLKIMFYNGYDILHMSWQQCLCGMGKMSLWTIQRTTDIQERYFNRCRIFNEDMIILYWNMLSEIHFTDGILLKICICWEIRIAMIQLLTIRSLQFFAHARTAQLSWHVQNFVVITELEFELELTEISIKFELHGGTVSGMSSSGQPSCSQWGR